MALMHDYAELINELRPTAEQFTEIEQYWVKRIQAFFTSKPFKLESDNSLSVDAAVEHLLRQAAQRRRENPGTMYVGTVLQHLVAAKLTIVAPEVEINGASVADDPSPRLPTVRPRTVSQNRPRLRPPVSSQLTTPTGSGASSRKRHCDAPYTRRRHCPVPPGTGRSAPLRCRAVRHPICTCQIEVEYGVVGLTHGVQNVRGHAAGGRPQVGFRLPAILRLRGKPASHESRQIAHAQIAAEEIRLPFAVRVAGDRGHAVKLPLIRFFAGIRGKHLHMRSGDGHVTELVDDAIEPVEIPMVFDGLEAISAEDGKGHGVDAGLAHQADVVIPDFLRPLVGTIVATESDAASVRGQQFWPYEVTSCTHGYLLWQAAQGHGPYRIPADRHSWPIVDTPPVPAPLPEPTWVCS